MLLFVGFSFFDVLVVNDFYFDFCEEKSPALMHRLSHCILVDCSFASLRLGQNDFERGNKYKTCIMFVIIS